MAKWQLKRYFTFRAIWYMYLENKTVHSTSQQHFHNVQNYVRFSWHFDKSTNRFHAIYDDDWNRAFISACVFWIFLHLKISSIAIIYLLYDIPYWHLLCKQWILKSFNTERCWNERKGSVFLFWLNIYVTFYGKQFIRFKLLLGKVITITMRKILFTKCLFFLHFFCLSFTTIFTEILYKFNHF